MAQRNSVRLHAPGRPGLRVLFGSNALRVSLVLGSALDLATGAYMMLYPAKLLALTQVPASLYGAMAFWPRYVGVFLFVLPVFYLLPVLDPSRYRGNAKGAVFGRSLGSVFYLIYCLFGGADEVFLIVASVNLAFALHYGIALARTDSSTAMTLRQ